MNKENKASMNSEDLGQLITENSTPASFIDLEEDEQLLSQGEGTEPEPYHPYQAIQWICSCGAINIGPTCSNCGASKK